MTNAGEAPDGNAPHLAEAVTLLQDAAGSGHPVMYPGTLEMHDHGGAGAVAGGHTVPFHSEATDPHADKTTEGPISRTIIRVIEWVIASLGGTPRG